MFHNAITKGAGTPYTSGLILITPRHLPLTCCLFRFFSPSNFSLLSCYMQVCSAEKADIHPNLIERCIEFCQGDIRKTLMHLQFWCQSNKCIKGEMDSESGCVIFVTNTPHPHPLRHPIFVGLIYSFF